MKVKNCAQVISHTVATALFAAAETSEDLPVTSQYYIKPAATQTGDLILFFDELFDTVDGFCIIRS